MLWFSALIPRIFFAEKPVAGGQAYMAKYAGMFLSGTSMDLGYAGEMYANFGYWGGLVGCAVYCLAFALLFRALCTLRFCLPIVVGNHAIRRLRRVEGGI